MLMNALSSAKAQYFCSDTTTAVLLCCQIRTAMVTGDHVRTAISVAHHCHILPVGRPVLLVDGPGPAAAGQTAAQASLSVLYPDGSVNSRVTPSAVLAQVGAPAAAGHCDTQGKLHAVAAVGLVAVADRHLSLPAWI